VLTRAVSAFLFAAILAGGFEPRYFRALFGDRSVHARAADRRAPDYPRFLEGVARVIEPGQSVFILASGVGYSYAYYRASYFLAGRRVIPAGDPDGRIHPERLREADYVALWRVPPIPGYEIVWRGHGGVLLRRPR
jgi:hypothetical protein